MIGAVIQSEDGSLNHLLADALCATRAPSILTLRIRDTLHIAVAIIAAAEVATIITIAADFTSHLDDDGAN